ncbi:MAG: glycosyltransferase family 2 protein [Candidatus Omnitrophota bacterium]
MKICVVIPAYNEENYIKIIVATLKSYGLDVIVVNDGSTDHTAAWANMSGALVLSHTKNKGKGKSLKTGFDYCIEHDYDAVITMDADGQHGCQEVKKFIEKFKEKNSDLIIGNRMHNPKNMPLVRKLTNIFTSNIISRLIKQQIEDSQCGFRLIKTEILKKMSLSTNKYDLESEMIFEIAQLHGKIESVEISSIYRGQNSRINPWIDTYRFMRLIIRRLVERRKKPRQKNI